MSIGYPARAMSKAPLHTYLRTHRRRSGLSQKEVALLIDLIAAGNVSRHETGDREPSFEQAFAYEALFGIPASALFPGDYEKARRRVEKNAQALVENLPQEPNAKAHKQRMEFLRALLWRVRME
jgi:transcriptional regulator with XRE-family HTH domain